LGIGAHHINIAANT